MNIALSQPDASGVMAPPSSVTIASWLRCLQKHLRIMIAALVLSVFAAAIVHAEELVQDWMPDFLAIPDDAEVMTDRAIGSSLRMFAFATGADVDVLFSDWEQRLGENGYRVEQGANDLLDRSIEFTGPGIANAKIIVVPSAEDEGHNTIEFDATLE